MVRLVLKVFCVCITLAAVCSTAQTSGATGALIKELSYLTVDRKPSAVSGKITLVPNESDCKSISATVEMTDSSEGTSFDNPQIFLAGAHLIVNGKVCLPLAGEGLVMRSNIRHLGDMVVEGDKVSFNGPVKVLGTASIRVVESAKVIEIKSDSDSQLEFEIRNNGLALVSGSGTAKTPEGKIYNLKR